MAYTAIVSLKQTLERLQISSHPRIRIPHKQKDILNDILNKLLSLQSFFDKISCLQDNVEFDKLEQQIRDCLQDTQDLIDSHVSDQILSGSETSHSDFSQKLHKVNQRLSSFTKTTGEQNTTGEQQPRSSFAVDSVSSKTGLGENKMIGIEDELLKLKQRLLRESRHKIIPIVGMAGIGKTALAKQVLCDPLIERTFPIRLFVTLGPKYELRSCLAQVLRGVNFRNWQGKLVEELGEDVYRSLESRRYLVVLDDIWDITPWNELRHFFPEDNDESRIIWTTRMPDVNKRAGVDQNAVEIGFLTAQASWDLLRQTVFGKSQNYRGLEEAGKKIAEKCEGLPLAIVEVGKHLCGANATLTYWTEAVESSVIYQSISASLSPTYQSLPQHLKSCFLYMGVFPANYNIPASQLIRLWIAEEFIDRYSCDSIEQRAEKYLEELVSRSLVIVHERSSSGRVKTCRIHFVYRYVCINEAQKENLFHILNKHDSWSLDEKRRRRRLCIHNDVLLGFKHFRGSIEECSAARSLICFGPKHQNPLPVSIDLQLLRVLHSPGIMFSKLSDQVIKPVRLKYLAVPCSGGIPAAIPSLGDLEFLIVNQNQRINPSRTPVYLPVQIWQLKKLRHLECMGFDLPDPGNAYFIDELLTLSGVSAHSCTQGVLSRMPNLAKLRIWFETTCHGFLSFTLVTYNLCHLKSFKLNCLNLGFGSPVISSALSFPTALGKLTLRGCRLPWHKMKEIAELPNLQVLKLQWYAFRGPNWEAHRGGFGQLKLLLLEDSNVEKWGSHSSQFSVLKSLIIRRCYQLKELPPEFGEIPTLESMELVACSESAEASAKRIREMQQEFRNNVLQLKLVSALEETPLQQT